jgi:uncharacterized peroxidase-related enzyme
MHSMYLKDVEAAPGSGGHARTIQLRRAAGQPIPQILHMLAYKPDRTDPLVQFAESVMRGPSPLSPAERELIAAFTSDRNRCGFCRDSHAATAVALQGVDGQALTDAILRDYQSAPIPPKLKALLTFVEKVNQASADVGLADVETAREAGWTDEALYDAITVCAMFNFFNRWVSASGVSEMPTGAYQISGKRMATEGYVPAD